MAGGVADVAGGVADVAGGVADVAGGVASVTDTAGTAGVTPATSKGAQVGKLRFWRPDSVNLIQQPLI